MVKARVHLRFQVQDAVDRPGCYSVMDVFTGMPAFIKGVPMVWLSAEDADDLVNLLNYQDLRRRGLRE